MKQRLSTIWLALLTVYLTCTTTDMYSTLRTVESAEECTLKYMQKSAKILKRLKNAKVIESTVDREGPNTEAPTEG